MSIVSEFKEFILRGNMVDLAVGLVVGAAFTTVVKSLVNNIIMPPFGFILGGVDFAQYSYEIAPALEEGDVHPVYGNKVEKDVEAVEIGYGQFLGDVLELLIVGLAIFLVVKGINSLKRKQEEAPKDQPVPVEVELLTEIRDSLKNRPLS